MKYLISTILNGEEIFYTANNSGNLVRIGTTLNWARGFGDVTLAKLGNGVYSGLNKGRLYINEEVSDTVAIKTLGSGLVVSTDNGAVNTTKYSNVLHIAAEDKTIQDGNEVSLLDGCKFALSFDNRQTWITYGIGWTTEKHDFIPDNATAQSYLIENSLADYADMFVDNQSVVTLSNEITTIDLSFKQDITIGGIHVDIDTHDYTTDVQVAVHYYEPNEDKWIYLGSVTVEGTVGEVIHKLPEALNVGAYTQWRLIITKPENSNDIDIRYLNIRKMGYDEDWVEVNLDELHQVGMNATKLQSLSNVEYEEVFQQGSINYAVYVPYGSSITALEFTLPTNAAPVVSKCTLSYSTVHKEDVEMSFYLTDAEGEDTWYRIKLNGNNLVDTDDGWVKARKEYIEGIVFDNDDLNIGSNSVVIEAHDESGAQSIFTYSITKSNNKPVVTGLRDDNKYTFTISDADLDKVKYVVKMNGTTILEVKDFVSTPITNKDVTWSKDLVILEKDNKLEITVEDELGEQYVLTETWVGEVNGLMFKDDVGDYLSNEIETVLKVLNLGVAGALQSTIPTKVILLNANKSTASTVEIDCKNNLGTNGVTYKLSNSSDMTNKTSKLLLGDMSPAEEKEFYIQITSNSLADIGKHQFSFTASSANT